MAYHANFLYNMFFENVEMTLILFKAILFLLGVIYWFVKKMSGPGQKTSGKKIKKKRTKIVITIEKEEEEMIS